MSNRMYWITEIMQKWVSQTRQLVNKEGALKVHMKNQNIVFEAHNSLTLHHSISCMEVGDCGLSIWTPPYWVTLMEFRCPNLDVEASGSFWSQWVKTCTSKMQFIYPGLDTQLKVRCTAHHTWLFAFLNYKVKNYFQMQISQIRGYGCHLVYEVDENNYIGPFYNILISIHKCCPASSLRSSQVQ